MILAGFLLFPPEGEGSGPADRVRADLAASGKKPGPASYVYYTVPPMSHLKRTHDTYPEDGRLSAPIRIVAAKGEFEPASIVFFPFASATKVELKVSDLQGEKGRLPASAVDVKVVKVWYQAGTAWCSYFADTAGRVLVPELLLHDEALVKVDRKTRDNYLRIGLAAPKAEKAEYRWISSPSRLEVPLNDHLDPVQDAASLQPFSFAAGEFKQVWFTLHAPKAAEGRYSGKVSVTVDGSPQGEIPIEVLVLPFELPEPMTNYDSKRRYYASIYNNNSLRLYCKKNGGDLERAKKRLHREYVNMREHNLRYPILDGYHEGEDAFFTGQLEVYKEAGLGTDAIFGAVPGVPLLDWMTSPEVSGKPLATQPPPLNLYRQIDRAADLVKKVIGDPVVYALGWDEPAMNLLVAERLPWAYLARKGVKVFTTGHAAHLSYNGYNEDFVNYGGSYSKAESAKWHAIGARITNYAAPHTGPENPDFVRRTHGLDNYLADCDGTANYMLNGSPWNDFAGEESNFRSFNMVYPAIDGPIDTIQWEGYREAIDDVRYATLLKTLANDAIATGETEKIYRGRMALQWLVLLDSKSCDLNAARAEMIAYILKLQSLLEN